MRRLVLLLSKDAGGTRAPEQVKQALHRLGHEAELTILTNQDTQQFAAGLGDLWPDGHPRGFLRWLALMRRISWADFDEIVDFENSLRTRFYRWAIRPCPAWYSAELKPDLFDNAA
jgi:hypothetical protein